MIKPTVGRVVWFTPSLACGLVHRDKAAPLAAMVTHVWGDRMVNLVVFDSNGDPHSKTSVTLLQDDDAKPKYGHFCAWMPYQVGQWAKSAGASAALNVKTVPVGSGLSFGEAIAALKCGKRVSRSGWNGKGMWLALQVPDANSKMSLPYIYMKTADDKQVPWLASQTDVLADDWAVFGQATKAEGAVLGGIQGGVGCAPDLRGAISAADWNNR